MGVRRKIAVCLGLGALLALVPLAILVRPAAALPPSATGAAFLGVACCSGTTCHGRSQPDAPVVREHETSIWQDEASAGGAHSRALRVLSDARAQMIAERLGIGEASNAP